ncbi:hypothetical protein C6P40_001103 [Pichia californica]|uniref:mRNA transport regulator MTR2 n=1 Tax=Pichia californica TaxID=460514 RepID=A0A9P7BID9_9ASCO|nr:hypothetical protein C6P42_002605 [[Candida] californica]KAG0690843.1 hypothetical protein C6P40_001103 [[Candida] californica]
MNGFQIAGQSQPNGFQNRDNSATVENYLTKLLESLDEPISNQQAIMKILPQLHQNPRIIINGNPFGSREQFQQLWARLPLSNHQITSCDVHFIPTNNTNNPSDGQYIVSAHLKVRFDESGKNKIGETASFNNTTTSSTRNIWSHWFGVSLSLVADSTIISNSNTEAISIWDYRFTENPISSVFKVN